MKKISKRLLALLMAMVMVLSMVACGNKDNEEDTDKDEGPTYEEVSAEVYENALGEYADYYAAAKEATNVSERFALMAIAEAKLMESAVMVPTTALGGNYAIGRLAPYTNDYALWGSDMDKFYTALVTTEPIKTEHRDAMKAQWKELKGTGTYLDWAESYLVDNGYTLKDTYTETYNGDPDTWDAFDSYLATVAEVLTQTYDGLLEYDCEGTLQPALATELPTVSEDGLTYTFKIREGVKWVDSQGREIAEVKADDWVAGLQHLLDACGGMEYLVQGVIKNANEYISGEVTDFAEVGVKAVDDYTLEYTLEAPCSYFTTMFGYAVFAPLCREYFVSQGGGFGADYDETAEDYTYGTSPDNIAYCGVYLVTSYTEKHSQVFTLNESYWNKDAVNIKTYTKLYNDGSEPTKAYTDMKAGTIDASGLNSSALEVAKEDGWFDLYSYTVTPDATTYSIFYNLNREAFANSNDETTVISGQSEEDKERTNAAMNNVHFRRALAFATDRAAYNAQAVGEDLKLVSLRNSYTPWNLVQLDEEVTVSINGEDTTFAAGTYYGEVMQAQITADGFHITVYDPTADNGNGSGDGYDGWYNVEAAVEEIKLAVAELKEAGVEVSAENPIKVELPFASNSETYTNKAQSIKQSVEAALKEYGVVIELVTCTDTDEWLYTGYYTQFGYESNYDMYDLSGWAPDYGDPSTFLDTFLGDGAGYCCKCLGLW